MRATRSCRARRPSARPRPRHGWFPLPFAGGIGSALMPADDDPPNRKVSPASTIVGASNVIFGRVTNRFRAAQNVSGCPVSCHARAVSIRPIDDPAALSAIENNPGRMSSAATGLT